MYSGSDCGRFDPLGFHRRAILRHRSQQRRRVLIFQKHLAMHRFQESLSGHLVQKFQEPIAKANDIQQGAGTE